MRILTFFLAIILATVNCAPTELSKEQLEDLSSLSNLVQAELVKAVVAAVKEQLPVPGKSSFFMLIKPFFAQDYK